MIYLLIGATLTVFVRDSWPLYSFCAAILLMLAVLAGKRQLDRISLLPLLFPAFGLLQLALASTADAASTRVAALRWFALAGVLMIAEARLADQRRRDRFLDQFLAFTGLTALLCLLQLNTSQGKALWYFDTGFNDVVYGFFPSRNNYGQFVELALAAALWRALTDRRRRFWFGLAGALLYASAIASTSRGAAVLATVELLVVPGVVLWRTRKVQFRDSGLLYAGVIGLALATAAVSGWDTTWKRFSEPDAYQGRREFTQSALRMAVERPLIGHGLGTFSLVYPKFATIDVPETVRFAHDDWAEFAADGGFLFAAFVFALFATAVPRMLRHPWSLGLVFVMVHAGFDYPFPRVAVAGWMFALLGALRAADGRVRSEPAADRRWWAIPVALVGCCVLGIYWCGRLGVADGYYRQDTQASVRRAIEIVPDQAQYYLRLAQLYESSHVQAILERALQLNPDNAEIWIEVGLDAELRGELKRAEGSLVKAAELDATWLPRWTLANYYFRRGGGGPLPGITGGGPLPYGRGSEEDGRAFWLPGGGPLPTHRAFWTWAAQAAAIANPRRDLIPLFKLASQLDPDPAAMLRIVPDRPAPLRQFVKFLLESGETRSLEQAAERLLSCGNQGNDRPYIFWAIEGFLSHRRPDGAARLWTKLRDHGWISTQAGGAFINPPLESSMDWRYKDVTGITRSLGSDGRLRFDFSGQQPEEVSLLERHVPVSASVNQRLAWNSSTKFPSGLEWQVQSLAGAVLAQSKLQSGGVEFTPPDSIVRLLLLYRRAPGTTRFTGVVDLDPALLLDHGQR